MWAISFFLFIFREESSTFVINQHIILYKDFIFIFSRTGLYLYFIRTKLYTKFKVHQNIRITPKKTGN